ncbi:MAG: DUF86 domain-containing protein [Bradymonadaceae bacterium]
MTSEPDIECDPDVVEAKLDVVRDNLARIEEVEQREPELHAWMVDDLYALYLRRSVESCVDLANHLVAANDWPTASNASEAFEILGRRLDLEDELVDALTSMVGFRNIAVHAYDDLDPDVVRNIVSDRLDDLRRFAREIGAATLDL